MANCREQVYSNDYFDFIINTGNRMYLPGEVECVQPISQEHSIIYYPREGLAPLEISTYTYSSIPKCYGLLDQTALEVTGILRLQNQPALALKGNGVLVGFLDTGIDYQNPLFRFSDGSSRISYLWDQTIEDGTPPEGILYGAEYTREQINEALRSEKPYEIVPSRDTEGHGTFLAGVTCGGEDGVNDFIGAVPQAEIAVVKLKEAKPYLREFYFIPQGVPVYQENDVMMAVSYLHQKAEELDMPLVICMALGSSMGSHADGGALIRYLNYICGRPKRCVVTATGNEANTRHHFQGIIRQSDSYEDVEVNVEQEMEGMFLELWASAPELFAVSVISPTGEELPRIPVRTGTSQIYNFVFERTTVSIDYRFEVTQEANQLIYFRFLRPSRGVWIIRVYPQSNITGEYNIWLPMRQMTGGEVFFLKPSPETTLTMPGTARDVITTGGYNAQNGAIYQDSGRGYTITGQIKPDFVAPAVNVYGPGLRSNYVTYTGTSAAAAITAGACAQILNWAIEEGNINFFSNATLKNILIRGTRRTEQRSYPNREWGYGILDVYRAFEVIRR